MTDQQITKKNTYLVSAYDISAVIVDEWELQDHHAFSLGSRLEKILASPDITHVSVSVRKVT